MKCRECESEAKARGLCKRHYYAAYIKPFRSKGDSRTRGGWTYCETPYGFPKAPEPPEIDVEKCLRQTFV